MTLMFIFLAAALAGGAFYIGMEFGALRERVEWEDQLSLPPPPEEEIPLLPEHASSNGGPYRTPDQLPRLPPARRKRGLFGASPEFGLTDLFKHSRHYGGDLDVYLANNSEMVAQIDIVRAINELEKYLSARQQFRSKPDELQRLFLAIVRERNSRSDTRVVLARLKQEPSTYSFHYMMVWALGEVWPPTGEVMRQLHIEKSFRDDYSGTNPDAERCIRKKAKEIIDRWMERDKVAVTLAMCE